MELLEFGKSNRDGKKLKIVLIKDGKKKTYHFGSDVSTTYAEGATETKKNAYLARHRVNENWNEINNGSLSRFILWGSHQSIDKNLKSFLKRFNITR
tara:strand:- start:67 stop:357 length:291 start_codon:yes stop_codon:yes gene_type:complete